MVGKFIFSCNLHKDDNFIPLLKIRNPFVCEVMSIWAELHFSDAVAISIANVGDQIIWLRPRPHLSGDFCIRKFFYADTKISASTRSVYESYTTVHTYPIRIRTSQRISQQSMHNVSARRHFGKSRAEKDWF